MDIKQPLNKNQLFIAAVVLALFLSYKLAFKKSIDAWQINKQLKANLSQGSFLTYQPRYIERKATNLNKIIGLYKVDTAVFRSVCVTKISLIAAKENVKLSDVPTPDLSLNTDKSIIQKITLQGSYFALLKTLNIIQQTEGIGIVRSVAFKLVNDQTATGKKMVADLYLQGAK